MSTPSLSDLEMDAWRGFLEAHRRVMDVLEDELRTDQDLPLAWYDVMVQLSEAPERTRRMQDLADAVLLSKSGLTRLVDRMERAGMVVREPCAGDRRGINCRLTGAGMQRLIDASPTHLAGVREHFVDLLEPGEAAILARALGRIAERACGEG